MSFQEVVDGYRVLMEDEVNGEKFNFAIIAKAKESIDAALISVEEEFPEAKIISVKPVIKLEAIEI